MPLREQKPLYVSALIDPNANIGKTLKTAGARLIDKNIWNVQDAYERPIGEHYQEFILGKEKGAQGIPEFYSIRYWPAKFFENSWTNLYHLGNKLGDDKRDMEISTTDPYTTMESLSGIGFQQILTIEFDCSRFKYRNFKIKILKTQEGLAFLQAYATYADKDEIDKKNKTNDMLRLLDKIGIAKENAFIGSALQYYIFLKQLPIPIEGQKYAQGPPKLPPGAPPEMAAMLMKKAMKPPEEQAKEDVEKSTPVPEMARESESAIEKALKDKGLKDEKVKLTRREQAELRRKESN